MIINDNLMSLAASNNLQTTQNDLQKVLQQLSSGLRINSAADDAAGLAIAQKMEAQINGLSQAQRNAQDAISLVQTAGGALTEIQNMLQRMRELAVQASSDTETTQDRQQLQNEVNQLVQEIQQIATTAQFNTQKLLDGSFAKKVFQIGANAGETLALSIDTMTVGALGVGFSFANATATVVAGTPTDAGIAAATLDSTYEGAIGNGTYTITVTTTSSGLSITLQDSSGNVLATGTASSGATSADLYDAAGAKVMTVTGPTAFVAGTDVVTIDKVTGTDITSASGASAVIQALDNAIQQVSSQQAVLGAYQNRLQHVINVNSISAQNLTSAKAQIMDVDMASAMAQFTRDQILQQAGIAALAQANQVPAAVLKLLG